MKFRKNKKKRKKLKPLDAWVEANIENLVLNPGIRKMFGIKTEDALDLIAKRLEDDRREKDATFIELEPFKIRYTEREIKELAKTFNWNGTGTEIDPIIIDNNEGLPQKFSISINSAYIKIIDCRFDYIILYDCQNFAVENCYFNTLGVINCSKISVKRSSLSSLNLDHSSNSYFKDCLITKAVNSKSHSNFFENCTITNETKRILQEGVSELADFLKNWSFVILMAGFCVAALTFLYIVNESPFGFYWYLSIIIFLSLIIIFVFLSKNQKKIIPNKIISNKNLNKI